MNNPIEIFTAASHHDVLALITQIAILLFTARAFGEIAQRLGQSSVLGEIFAGILLGPSCLGKMFPFLVGVIIPGTPTQGHLIEAISLMGAMFLLLITGFEMDLSLIRRHARTALGVSIGGVIFSSVSGFLFAQIIPDSLLTDPHQRLFFSLMVAIAMSIASIPIIAKVLLDLKLIRRDVGQTIIAAGMSDDTIGWIGLSIVTGLVNGKILTVETIAVSTATVIIFLFLSYTVGRWLTKRILDFVQDHTISQDRLLTLVVVVTFMGGAVAKALHIEPILGAFVVGILFGQMPRLPKTVHQQLETITMGIFGPIFFATAGLKVNIPNLLQPHLLTLAVLMTVIAASTKMLGGYLGARFISRQNIWTSLSFGIGLTAHGAMGIIIATIGLSLNLLSQEIFSIVVLMSMITSLMAPFLLRWVLQHVQPNDEEIKRLKQEELNRGSSIGRIHRVLVPVRNPKTKGYSSTMQVMKLRILQKITMNNKLSITLLCADKDINKSDNIKFLNELTNLFPNQEFVKKAVPSSDVLNVVLDEAQKDYDLLVLGASRQEQEGSSHLFSPVIDSLITLSPCLTMVVYTQKLSLDWSPQRILVPTNGSFAAKRAAEFSFLLASDQGTSVNILNVLEKDKNNWQEELNDDIFQRQLKIAEKITEELAHLGEMQGVVVYPHVQIGLEPETVIIDVARQKNSDLIVLGTDVRPASDRLFLGPRVERILKNAPCPMIVLNAV